MRSHRTAVSRVLMACLVVGTFVPLLATPRCAVAAPLSPGAFSTLGILDLAPGTYTIDPTWRDRGVR